MSLSRTVVFFNVSIWFYMVCFRPDLSGLTLSHFSGSRIVGVEIRNEISLSAEVSAGFLSFWSWSASIDLIWFDLTD